jgi:hypothetical protein
LVTSDKLADVSLSTKLPVGATIAMTWRFLLRAAGTYLLQTIFGALILVGIAVGSAFALVFLLSPRVPMLIFLMYGLVVVMALVFAPMAIECQRAVLVGQRPSFGQLFRFDRRTRRFIAVELLYLHITTWPFLLVFLFAIAHYAGASALAATYFGLAGSFTLFGVIWTLSTAPGLILSLPMCSVDRPSPLLRQAWRLSRANRIRILCVLITTALPVLGLYALLIICISVFEISSQTGVVATNLISTILQYVVLLMIMIAAACAYQKLSGEHPVYRVFD